MLCSQIHDMQSTRDNSRILALAIRSQRLGYAVLEDSVHLLDWGMMFYRKNDSPQITAMAKRVALRLRLFAPSVVVMERGKSSKARDGSMNWMIHKSIRREVARRSIPLRFLRRADIRRTFHDFQAKSKDEIAAVLARMFPEVAYKLPRKRKIWEGEHPIMPLFDAIALGVGYWDHHRAPRTSPE